MDIEHILSEFEKERQTEILAGLTKKALAHKNIKTRYGAAGTLGLLAYLDYEEYETILDSAIKDTTNTIRSPSFGSLINLAFFDPEKSKELFEKYSYLVDEDTRRIAQHGVEKVLSFSDSLEKSDLNNLLRKQAHNLGGQGPLAEEMEFEFFRWAKSDPDRFKQGFSREISKELNFMNDVGIRLSYLALSDIDPNRFVELFWKDLDDLNPENIPLDSKHTISNAVNYGRVLAAFADSKDDKTTKQHSNQKSFFCNSLFWTLVKNKESFGEYVALGALDMFANKSNLGYYRQIFKQEFSEHKWISHPELWPVLAHSLESIAEDSPDEWEQLFRFALSVYNTDANATYAYPLSAELANGSMMEYISSSACGIWSKDVCLFSDIFTNLLGSHDEHVANGAAMALLKVYFDVARKYRDNSIKLADPQAKGFIESYLGSRYAHQDCNEEANLKSDDQLIRDLSALISERGINYQRLAKILGAGKADNLQEMVELSRIDIEDYLVLQKIGKGAMGKVCVALDNLYGTGIEEVIKLPFSSFQKESSMLINELVVKQGKTEQEAIDELIVREGKTLDYIQHNLGYHKNIVGFRGLRSCIIDSVKRPVLYLEDLRGGVELSKYYNSSPDQWAEEYVKQPGEKGAPRPTEAKSYRFIEHMEALARTLDSLEKIGIVAHNDLHADNIIVMPDNEVKIIDFGLAQLDGAAERITGYRPAAANSNLPVKIRNVWNMGCLIYNLLTKEHPYHFSQERNSLGWREMDTSVPPDYSLVNTGDRFYDETLIEIMKKCFSGDEAYTTRELSVELMTFPMILNIKRDFY